jgi:hypothetical protein
MNSSKLAGSDICNILSKSMSIIIGIVLGVLLYSIYNPPILIKGPNSRDFVDKEFKYLGKTYRLDARVCACPRFAKLY